MYAFHHRVSSILVGDHPSVSRLLSGKFNERAPQPSSTFIWNVEVVLKFKSNWGVNSNLSLKERTCRLTMLLASTALSGVYTITNLNLKIIARSGDKYVFHFY